MCLTGHAMYFSPLGPSDTRLCACILTFRPPLGTKVGGGEPRFLPVFSPCPRSAEAGSRMHMNTCAYVYVYVCLVERGIGEEGYSKATVTALGVGLSVVLAWIPLPASLLDCEMNRLREESEDFWGEGTLGKGRPRDAGRRVGPCPFI